MPALSDRNMERLSDLFAQGSLNNAPEIAKLLEAELRERPNRLAKNQSLSRATGDPPRRS